MIIFWKTAFLLSCENGNSDWTPTGKKENRSYSLNYLAKYIHPIKHVKHIQAQPINELRGRAMISLKNISLYYPPSKKLVLSGITWHIRPGEQWVLFGRNGSGKTRLLEIITGYNFPSTGTVSRFGQEKGYDIRQIRKKTGIVNTLLKDMFLQSEPLINVVLSGLFASIGLFDDPAKHDTEKARALLNSIGMADRSQDPFGILSDGEKQKVLMLRALINNPSLVILDEPCMGLDIAAREDLLADLQELILSNKISAIYVTHHVEEIIPLFDKIYILHNGTEQYSGSLKDGLTSEMLSGIFQREILKHNQE